MVADEVVCQDCAERTWYFDRARSACHNRGQVREAVTGFKYHDQYYRHGQLVAWLVEGFDRHMGLDRWDALVPVPLYHRRRRERGFNQALELARGLASARKIPISNCLYRYRETPAQVGLGKVARWENMTGAFHLKPGFDVRGLNLLLVDDVFTTGATTNACAQVLTDAGAGRLAVLTVARS
jgi:ComF family protein